MTLGRRRSVAVGLALGLACITGATSPVGAWKGHIVIDYSKAHVPKDQTMAAQFNRRVAEIKMTTFEIVFRANHTYRGVSKRGSTQSKPQVGTWSQSKNVVTITDSKKRSDGKLHHQMFIFSPNGKGLTAVLPAAAGVNASLVLTR